MKIDFNAVKDLPLPVLERIERGLMSGFKKIDPLLALGDMNAVVKLPGAFGGMDRWGIDGLSKDPHLMEIYVDPSHPRFDDSELEERLSALIAEEAHHCVRRRDPGFGDTLGKCLITEGLAKCFVEETGHPVC